MSKFNAFTDETPQTTGYAVGYRGTKEKRYLWSNVVSFLQGVLNIRKLDRNSDNHLEANGSGSGSAPALWAVGTDANIDLELAAKGTGAVRLASDFDAQGNDLDLSGGTLDTSGGDILTDGGAINTNGGNLSVGIGTVSVSPGGSINSDDISSSSGTINLNDPVEIVNQLIVGTGLNEFLIDTNKMRYGGADGMLLDVASDPVLAQNTVNLQLGDDSDDGFSFYSAESGSRKVNYLKVGEVSNPAAVLTVDTDDPVSGGHKSEWSIRADGPIAGYETQVYANRAAAGINIIWNGVSQGGLYSSGGADCRLQLGNDVVLEPRKTGWGVPTGTATKTTFDTATVTTADLAERVKALIDDLTDHGLIGA